MIKTSVCSESNIETDGAFSDFPLTGELQEMTCKKHLNEVILKYCDTCKVLACELCIENDHREHTIIDLKTHVKKEKMKLELDSKIISVKIDKIDTEYKLKSMQQQHSIIRNKVINCFDKLINALTQRKAVVLQQLEERSNFGLNEDQLRNQLIPIYDSMREELGIFKKNIDKADAEAILNTESELIKDFNGLIVKLMPISTLSYIQLVFNETSDVTIEDINKFGNLSFQSNQSHLQEQVQVQNSANQQNVDSYTTTLPILFQLKPCLPHVERTSEESATFKRKRLDFECGSNDASTSQANNFATNSPRMQTAIESLSNFEFGDSDNDGDTDDDSIIEDKSTIPDCTMCRSIKAIKKPSIECTRCQSNFHLSCLIPRMTSNQHEGVFLCARCIKTRDFLESIETNKQSPVFLTRRRVSPFGLRGSELRICERILTLLYMDYRSFPFHCPKTSHFKKIKQSIRNPLPFSFIKEKLNDKSHEKYETLDAFFRDLNKVFDDCVSFYRANEPSNSLIAVALDLGVLLSKLKKEHFPNN